MTHFGRTFGMLLLCGAAFNATAADVTPAEVTGHYAVLVHASYADALADAKDLQKAVAAFLKKPDDAHLTLARQAWLKSRESYGQTEAFRFGGGPIDFSDKAKKEEGPEARINSWPLNEAYIDYVKGNSKAGIVGDAKAPIDKEALAGRNQAKDEADVSTGYHAIEFLLWGQDLDAKGPGARPASDYTSGDKVRDRRRDYLKNVTDLLVDDLTQVTHAWEGGKDNYAKTFTAADPKESLAKAMTGLATLSGFELASERMATALDSGDQEDEHSCFSDNTHRDFVQNAQGIANVYFGTYENTKGASIDALLRGKDAKLADELASQVRETVKLANALPHPVDREILASPKDSAGRKAMEAAIASLQKQAELFKKAGEALGVEVKIVTE